MASINYVELKVADLREECRKRSLDSTGLKVHLVERLKKFDRDEIRLKEEKEKAAEIAQAKPEVHTETKSEVEIVKTNDKTDKMDAETESKEIKPIETTKVAVVDSKKSESKPKSIYDKKKDMYELAATEPEGWSNRTDIILDYYNSDLNVCIDESGVFAQPLHKDGFQFMYGGVKATYGVTSGKVYYEVRIYRRHYVDWMSEASQMNQLRVGWSTDKTSLSLGDELMSFAYDSNGKKMTEGTIAEYGEGFSEGDVIGCFLEFVGDTFTIRYSINGKNQGDAFVIPSRNLLSNILVPHIYTRNMSFEVNFGGKEPWMLPKTKASDSDETIIDDLTWVQIGKLNANQRVKCIKAPENFEECEVLMMCGLPGSGKTYWAEKHLIENSAKHYNILSVNKIMEKMKIPNRKSMSNKTRDNILQAATDCLNKLIEIVVSRKRNYILDQTNVYPNAQRRRMCPFDKFLRKAIIVIPTDQEFQNRIKQAVEKEDKDIPEKAMLQLKENFVIPDEKSEYFDEIIFVELQRSEAVELIKKYSDEAKALNKKSYSSSKESNRDHKNDKKSTKEDDFGSWNAKSDEVTDDKWSRSSGADDGYDKGKSSSRSSKDRKDSSSHRRSSNRDDDRKDSRNTRTTSKSNKRDDRRSSSDHRREDKDDSRRNRFKRSRSPGDRRRNDRRPESNLSKPYPSNSGTGGRYNERMGNAGPNYDNNRTMSRQNIRGRGRGYAAPLMQMNPLTGPSRYDSDYQCLRRDVGSIDESLDSLIRRYDDRSYDSHRPRDDFLASRGRGRNNDVPSGRQYNDDSYDRGVPKDDYNFDSGYGKPLRGREGYGMGRNRDEHVQQNVRDDYPIPKSREDYLMSVVQDDYPLNNNYGGPGGYDRQEMYRQPYNQDELPSSTQSSKLNMSKERKSRFGDRNEPDDTQHFPSSSMYQNYSHDRDTNKIAGETRILPEKYRGPGLINKRQLHTEPDSSSSNAHMLSKMQKYSQYSEQYGSVNSTQDYNSFMSVNNQQSQNNRSGYGQTSNRGGRGAANNNQPSPYTNSASLNDYSYPSKPANFGLPQRSQFDDSYESNDMDSSNNHQYSNYEDEPSSTTSAASQYRSYDDFVKKIKKPMPNMPPKPSVTSTSFSPSTHNSNPFGFYGNNSDTNASKGGSSATSSYGASNQILGSVRKCQMDDQSQPTQSSTDYYGQNVAGTNSSSNNYYTYSRGGYNAANTRGGYGASLNSTKPNAYSGSTNSMNTNFSNTANTGYGNPIANTAENSKPSSSTDNAKFGAGSGYTNQGASMNYSSPGANTAYGNSQSYTSNVKPILNSGYGKPVANTGNNNPNVGSGYAKSATATGYNTAGTNASYNKPSGNTTYSNPIGSSGFNKYTTNPSGTAGYTANTSSSYNIPNSNLGYTKPSGNTAVYANPSINTSYGNPSSANSSFNIASGNTAYGKSNASSDYNYQTGVTGYGNSNVGSSTGYTKPTVSSSGSTGYNASPSMAGYASNTGYNKPSGGNAGFFNSGVSNPLVSDKSNSYSGYNSANIPLPMTPTQRTPMTATTNKPGFASTQPPNSNYQPAQAYSYPQNYPY